MYCINCGKKIQKDIKYCPHCGKPNGSYIQESVPSPAYSTEPKQTQPAKQAHPTLTILFIGLLTMVSHAYFYGTAVFSVDKNNITTIFLFIYFVLFILFLGTLFKKPVQTAPAKKTGLSPVENIVPEKKRSGGWKWLIAIIFICLSSFYILSTSSSGSINPVTATSLVIIVILMITGFIWHFIVIRRKDYKNIFNSLAGTVKFLVHHPKPTIFLTIAYLTFIFIVYLVFAKISNDYFSRMKQIIPVIQDSLSEVAAAKIMGDSLYKGKYIVGSSWTAVQTNSANTYSILNTIVVPDSLSSYKHALLNWSNRISVSAQNTYTWNELSAQPENFILKASDSQVKELLKVSLTRILELKELGANAIERKDKETMRYIAAKLLVQEHWINGIQHAKNPGFLTFKLVSDVQAYTQQDCVNIAVNCVTRCANSVNVNNININNLNAMGEVCAQNCVNEVLAYCKDLNNSQPNEQPVDNTTEDNTTQDDTNQDTQPRNTPTQDTQLQNTSEPTVEAPTPIPTPYIYDPEPRDTCFIPPGQHGGTCYGPAGFISTTEEMAAAAIKFSEGNDLTVDEWNKQFEKFDNLFPSEEPPPADPQGGVGITIGEPLFEIHVPLRVQKFYDECAAKGGHTGNWSQIHSRLPTTESGYNCSYGQNDYCWDFLTYSGGRYMGGNPGSNCAQRNLVPIIGNAPVLHNSPPAQVQAENLDGTYDIISWGVNKECKNLNKPTSFNVNGNIVYNMWGWGNGNPTINTTGAAKCKDNSCSYQFYGSGTKSYITGTGLESIATCPKNSKCTKSCQFSITAKHR
jgi:hypothetical protein